MKNISFDFSGSVIIVTGGTRGIGRAICEAFLRAGAVVTAIFANDVVSAGSFAEEWRDYSLKLCRLDVSDYAAVEGFFRGFNAENKSLEALVNCAGVRRDAIVGMMSFEDWSRVLGVNITGTFNMSKFALMKMMEARFGRIINICSPSGKYGFAGQANYASSKAAQEAFTKSLAKEAARRNITVNCVSPGFIDTDLTADIGETQRKAYIEQIPLKRFGKPEEVAEAVLFLASREASYISGATYEVTGGL